MVCGRARRSVGRLLIRFFESEGGRERKERERRENGKGEKGKREKRKRRKGGKRGGGGECLLFSLCCVRLGLLRSAPCLCHTI